MNNEEAKLILNAYRPGGQDAGMAQFREALEQTRRDPELGGWFAKEQTIDSRISDKVIASLKPPARLKSQLLAQRKIARPAPMWRIPRWQALAASVVLFATLAAFWLNQPTAPQVADFRQAMIQNSARQTDHLSFTAQDMMQIKGWLKARNVAVDFELPASLAGAPVHGCRVVDWNGQKVTLLCFMPNGGGHLDLFVIDLARFRDFTPSETAQFTRSDGVTTAIWRKGGKTYLLAGAVDEPRLRKLL